MCGVQTATKGISYLYIYIYKSQTGIPRGIPANTNDPEEENLEVEAEAHEESHEATEAAANDTFADEAWMFFWLVNKTCGAWVYIAWNGNVRATLSRTYWFGSWNLRYMNSSWFLLVRWHVAEFTQSMPKVTPAWKGEHRNHFFLHHSINASRNFCSFSNDISTTAVAFF